MGRLLSIYYLPFYWEEALIIFLLELNGLPASQVLLANANTEDHLSIGLHRTSCRDLFDQAIGDEG